MRELSLHLLDIAENSVAAQANRIEITIIEDTKNDRLKMKVSDNGCGMDAEMAARVVDPFVTSRTTRKVGLGIPLLKAAAEGCNGGLTIESEIGKGTTLAVEFQRNHIDRMPLGDVPSTLLHLIVANPDIRWVFTYQVDEETFFLDSDPIRQELDGIPLTEPVVLAFLRELITTGIQNIQPESLNLFP